MNTPALCATITADSMDQLRARRDAVRAADLVELRLDGVRDPDVAGALQGRHLPVIVTCRAGWEGGRFEGSEEERRRLLEQALREGADWVDLEWRGGFETLVESRRGRNIVLSSHDFEGVPTDLDERYRAMRATGAHVVKLAVTPDTGDALRQLRRLGTDDDEPRVLIGMGQLGVPSRVLPARFGSAWTYAGDGVAPGQISVTRLLERYRFRSITETTPIYGVAGSPIGHSLSPAMHNAGLAALDRDAVYVPVEAADADDLRRLAEDLSVVGLSVTAPFKEGVLGFADTRDPLVQRVGAANTLRRVGDGWEARNTDVAGFLAPLAAYGRLAGRRATVLGAGGAARGVAVGLSDQGARVSVCARRVERAREVAAVVGGDAVPFPPEAGSWDLLVNTTPIGTAPHGDESPVPATCLTGGRLVYDLIYNPDPTRLMRDARAAGCETIGGLDMLVAQALDQFEWWFGERPSAEVFRAAATEELSQEKPE